MKQALSEFKYFVLQMIFKKVKDNVQNGRKYLQIIYLIKDCMSNGKRTLTTQK